jgi:hypothetical protein
MGGFENRVLRRICGPKRDKIIADCKKLHDEELNNLHFSPHVVRMVKSRMMRWAVCAAHMEEKRNAYRVFVGKPEGKRPLVRPRCRWILET